MSGQFEDNNICYDCDRRYYENYEEYYQNCTQCTSIDVCTDCSGTYFRKDNKGCILNCNYDTEFDAIVNYNLNGEKKCVKYCKTYGTI